MKPAIEARGLTQRFGRQPALLGVHLEVAPGERVAVLGDNGAGKTTLLRLLATVMRPSAGELRLFGLDAVRQRAALRPRLGWLAHEPGLYSALTARENLEFFCTLHGLPADRAGECLELLGLAEDAARAAGELSRGRRQRLALARTLLHDPELWVLDEPDSSLDAEGRGLLGRLAGGRTLVFATHDRALAEELGARVVELRAGRVVDRSALKVVH
ncbi:MAG TPA: heme ABC exporter ATP-binding protein CcmA [Candidatus Dormibacteraeota bacterium]